MSESLDPSEGGEVSSILVPAKSSPHAAGPQRLQFSLAGLMLLTALMAGGIVLLKSFGHWGLVAITSASFVFTYRSIDWAQRKPTNPLVDLVWGVCLPLLCFAYDPGMINSDHGYSTFGDAVIGIAIWQMVLLIAWLMLGPGRAARNGFLTGGMIVGTVLAGLLAIPFTAAAMLFTLALGFGIPGFVPLMTTWVFARNSSQASFLLPADGEPARASFHIAAAIGLVLALLGPIAIVLAAERLGYPLHFPRLPGNAFAIDFFRF